MASELPLNIWMIIIKYARNNAIENYNENCDQFYHKNKIIPIYLAIPEVFRSLKITREIIPPGARSGISAPPRTMYEFYRHVNLFSDCSNADPGARYEMCYSCLFVLSLTKFPLLDQFYCITCYLCDIAVCSKCATPGFTKVNDNNYYCDNCLPYA